MYIIEDFRSRIVTGVDSRLVSHITNEWENYCEDLNDYTADPENMEAKGVTENSLLESHDKLLTKLKLLTSPEMAVVWSRINKRIYKVERESHAYWFQYLNYVRDISLGLNGGNYWQTLAPSQRNSEYQELITSLKGISSTLEKIGYREPALGFMDDEDYSKLKFQSCDEWGDFTRWNSHYFYRIPELLNKYAEALHSEQRHKDVLVDRPNGKSADMSYFVRHMNNAHRRNFGSPLYDTISVIAGIFYPDHDTSYNRIRESIRAMDQ